MLISFSKYLNVLTILYHTKRAISYNQQPCGEYSEDSFIEEIFILYHFCSFNQYRHFYIGVSAINQIQVTPGREIWSHSHNLSKTVCQLTVLKSSRRWENRGISYCILVKMTVEWIKLFSSKSFCMKYNFL